MRTLCDLESLTVDKSGKFTKFDADELKTRSTRRRFDEIDIEIMGSVVGLNYEGHEPYIKIRESSGKEHTAQLAIDDGSKVTRVKVAIGTATNIRFKVEARESEDGEPRNMIVTDFA